MGFDRLSRAAAEAFVREGIIGQEDFEIYRYGVEAGLMIAVNLALSAAVAASFRMLPEGLLFLALYIPLRSYAGGGHAKSIVRCTCLLQLIVALELLAARWAAGLPAWGIALWAGGSLVVNVPSICLLAPVESENHPLDEEERTYSRRMTRRVVAAQAGICGIGLLFGCRCLAAASANVWLIQNLLLWLGTRKIRGR